MTPAPTPPPAAVEAMDNLLRNTPWLTPQHDHGAAGFCTNHAPTLDERTETVARVLREHSAASFAENPDDASQWAWRCSGCAAVLFGSSAAPKVGNVPGVQFLTVALAAHQAAAVVAALDDESARLREEADDTAREVGILTDRLVDASRESALLRIDLAVEERASEQWARKAGEHRAALNRVRATIPSYAMDETTFWIRASDLRAALDPEEPR